MKKLLLFVGIIFFFSVLTNAQELQKPSFQAKSTHFANKINAPKTGGCDTLFPLSFTTGSCYDSLTLYVPDKVAPMDTGYISGQNGKYHWAELTEKYKVPAGLTNSTISDVFVMYALKAGLTGNTTCKIYSNNAGKPGTVLGTSATIVKNNIDTTNFGLNFNNKYHFSTPISVTSGTTYFMSITIPATWTHNTDELAIWEENMVCSAVDSSAYLLYGSTWYAFYTAFGKNIDMMILPAICTTTGVQDYSSNNMIGIYPNPAKNIVNIVSNNDIENIKIINTVGQVVYEKAIETKNILINTSEFNAGIYFVQIKNKEGITTKPIEIYR